ncbi:MAG: DUF4198 domain-containing protein [Desulfobulbaceae bacterium]|nr:DUF4198 domain-containing protein [Desulfobulbaceae bacterium]
MYRLASSLILSFTLGLPLSAFAHDFWVNAEHDAATGQVKAQIGYGHDFPAPEAIAADRVHIFKPLRMVSPAGSMEMTQKGENYAYESAAKLKKGSYLVLGDYKPTFWAKNAEGWKQANRSQMTDATYCEEAVMSAKTILNVNGGMETELISKPVGQKLEVVPLANPATVRPGAVFPVQVMFDGKPVKTAEVSATFAEFPGNAKDSKAFYGRTDLEGKIDIVPLKAGYWYMQVKHTVPYSDLRLCDEVIAVATLTAR